MSSIAPEADPIKNGLLSTLSESPSEVGRRLQSEEMLAKSLGVGVRQVRKSLNELVDEGVLVRRRGSGTYVRRVPSAEGLPEGESVPPEVLFVGSGGHSAVNGRPAALRLGLWSDLVFMQHPNQEILAGMAYEAEQLGHSLAVHSVVQRRDQPMAKDELAARLERVSEDGCIVNARWADLFEAAETDNRSPVIYYNSSSRDVRHVPLMMFNTDEGVDRAMQILAEQGCKRIALLARAPAKKREEAAYEVACRKLRQDYRGSEFLDFFSPSVMQQVGRKVLEGSEKPDGIYVADDHLVPGFVQTLNELGLKVGRDLAVITLSNAGVPLPEGHDWSRLEFDPHQLGRTLVNCLVQTVRNSNQTVPTQAICAEWRPGQTHRRVG